MPANPLSKEQLAELAKAKAVIPELKEQIRLAKQAKIDVSEMETQLAQAEDRIDTLLRVYGNLPTAEDLTGQ